MDEDQLDDLATLERAERGVIDAVVAGDVGLDVGADLLELTGNDPQLVRELLVPLADETLVDLVHKTVGGAEVPTAAVPDRRP